jgi:hypothetical protein
MRTADGGFERTDIWREGKWLDLWSVVHFLSGISVGFVLFLAHFSALASVVIALLSFISYEMWEAMVRIEEMPTNRFMDVVVGMAGFLPVFFVVAPRLSVNSLPGFGLVLTMDIVMSIFGWRASQKAAALEARMRARYARERVRLLRQRSKLRDRFRR